MKFRPVSILALTATAAAAFGLLTGCTTTGPSVGGGSGGSYNVVAYRPHNPSNVRVKVSLNKQAVYVMEGEKALMVAACTIGIPAKPTPKGNFRIYNKIAHKRSGSYGFYTRGGVTVPAEAGKGSGSYTGYPMAYWCEFAPAYGFHQGYVWPVPRSHGCLRLHKTAAPKFYALVHEGTPVSIAQSQPEDVTVGANVRRPNDYNDPDPPAAYMASSQVFNDAAGSDLKTY